VADSSALHAFYAHPLSQGTRTIAVQERPLDELLDPPLGVIKIDVEGPRWRSLRGPSEPGDGGRSENPGVGGSIPSQPTILPAT